MAAESQSGAPRFSVVIPTYNRATSVAQTLASVFAQTLTDIEVIVVDDGSSDDTLAALARIDDPRLVVVAQQNAGPAAARNHGVRRARGDYVAFLDSDDRWSPRFLAVAQQTLEQHGPCVLYGQIVVDRGVDRYWIKPDRAMRDDEPIHDFLYVHGGFIQTSTMVVPRDLARRVSWDESVTFGDNDQFAIDLWATGTPFRMLPEPLLLYADAMSPDALSQLPIFGGDSPQHTNFFAWMDAQRPVMSERARLGFDARFLSGSQLRRRPLASFAMVLRAWRSGAIGTGGALRQTLQNVAPRSYRRLTDAYVRLKGQPLPADFLAATQPSAPPSTEDVTCAR